MEKSKKELRADLIHLKYDFRWEVLDVMVGGKSIIDSHTGLSGFPLHNHEDADRFMKAYGYDGADPIESAEVMGNFQEALNFIRKHFLYPQNPDGLALEIPRKISELTDVKDLLLIAAQTYPGQSNDPQGQELRAWACAVLKVVHTIAHVDRDYRTPYFTDIQKQILDRFYKFVQRDPEGRLYLGTSEKDPLRVYLVSFETKPKKARDSVLMKMLHKAEHVVDDIFDQVGVRLVTPGRLESLQALKYLKESLMVMPPNIKPSRSRNTLVDVESLKPELEGLLSRVDQGELDEPALVAKLQSIVSAPDSKKNKENPHSSDFFQAIQFTCRQLIKLKNPLYDQVNQLKEFSRKEKLPDSAGDLIERIDLQYLQKEVRFFFPFEVQIMDEKSKLESEQGRSSHAEYKSAQLRVAMRRVMGSLMEHLNKTGKSDAQ